MQARSRMHRRTALAWERLPLLLLAACGGTDSGADDAVTAKLPPVNAAAQQPQESVKLAESPAKKAFAVAEPADLRSPKPRKLRSSHYTSLDPSSCKLLDGNAEEATSLRRRCVGFVDYALETSESSLLHDLTIISPDGHRSELNLSNLVAGARLGKTAEWRSDEPGQPRALIVRVHASANAGSRSNISNLIVTRLNAPACIVAVIPRGPRQNEKARAVADGKLLECMKD